MGGGEGTWEAVGEGVVALEGVGFGEIAGHAGGVGLGVFRVEGIVIQKVEEEDDLGVVLL